jgi:hypothetical protein
VQPQGVQFRVVAGGTGIEVDLTHLGSGQSVSDRAPPPRLRRPAGGVLVGLDQLIVLGVPVDTAQRGDEVLRGAAPTAGVAGLDGVGLDLLGELLDLGWSRFQQTAGAPFGADAVPVGAVDLAVPGETAFTTCGM